MLKNNTVRLVFRRVILAAAIVVSALIQNSASGILAKYNTGCFLLLPLTVSVAMFEKEFAGLFYGLLAGALWDLASPATDGVYALFFTLAAFFCGLLTHFVFRNSFKSAAVLTAGVFLLFSAVSLTFICLVKDFSGVKYYATVFLPRSAAVTAVSLPLSYYAVSFAEKRLRPEKQFTV